MKYGQVFQRDSEPKWAVYNVDYNELKNLIKVHTKRDVGQAIAIPGQTNEALAEFEELFFNELYNQHDRVDLFVKSKTFETQSRLKQYEKQVVKLLQRVSYDNGNSLTQSRWERFGKYDRQISRCGQDIKSLQRFVDAQRTAFRKILKKYRKWTGSRALDERFNREVLGSPKSFTRQYGNFESLLTQQRTMLALLRQGTPDSSVPTTPQPQSRRPSEQLQSQHERQSYWNEYDDGSEAGGDEPYTIYVDPNAESTFPGAKALSHGFEKMKEWLKPNQLPDERRPLLENGTGNGNTNGYFTEQTETDADDEAYASSGDFPINGYETNYSTFPSVREQKFSRSREQLLFRGSIISFVAAFVLLGITSTLVATGRHKLRIEVDAGAMVGIVTSLFFAAIGLVMALNTQTLGWIYRICIGIAFISACSLNGMLLLLVVENVKW